MLSAVLALASGATVCHSSSVMNGIIGCSRRNAASSTRTKVRRVVPGQPQAALQVEGEFLHAWTKEERVRSHLPVVLTRGGSRFVGDSMNYDNLSQVIELKGRVRGVIESRK